MSNPFQQRLFQYEIQPPARAWENISASLDNKDDLSSSERLYPFELKPPPDLWQKIEKRIESDQRSAGSEAGGHPVPLWNRFHRPFRYAGAAAAVLLVAFGARLLVARNQAAHEAVVTNHERTGRLPVSNQAAMMPAAQQVTGTADLKAAKAPKETNDLAAQPSGPATHEPQKLKPHSFKQQPAPMEPTVSAGRYVVYASSTGTAVKVSKKLYDLFACSDMDVYCRQHIELLQQKMASAPEMSSADFTSVLDLVKNLQNNQ